MFESLQDELIQRKLMDKKEREDYVCKTKDKHFRCERLLKLIIRKRRCKEFIEFINEMPCHRHISEKIAEFKEKAKVPQPSPTGNVINESFIIVVRYKDPFLSF